MRVIRHLSIIVVLVGASCNVAAPIPSPTSSAAPTPFATLGGIDTPVPPVATSSPLVPATEPPPTDSEPTPTAMPTEPPTRIWRRVEGLLSPAAHVTEVLAGGPGFVAVGYYGDDSYPCEELTVDGRAWTSSDGEQWSELRPQALAGLSLTRAVNADGTFYAFGQVGDSDCANDYQLAVVRSTDGTQWERLNPDLPNTFFPSALGSIGQTLIVLDEDSSWTSADGAHWQRSGDLPFSYSWFNEVTSVGQTVVVLDGNDARPAWFSGLTGDAWRQSEFQSDRGLNLLDSTVGTDLIVVVGEACCSLPNTEAGVSLTSTDGTTWLESAPFRDTPQAVVAIAGGYMAVGRSSWVSHDGIDWHVGPPLPDFAKRSEVVAVSAAAGVLVINGEYAWFAQSDALDADGWVQTPVGAEMPEIGLRYSTDVFLHCGWPAIQFGFRTWLPDPPFEDNINPPPGFGDQDRGWLTQMGDNELLYESRRGPTVTLRPAQAPEFEGPCA